MEPVGAWDARPLRLAASLSTAAAQRTDDSLQSSPEAAAVQYGQGFGHRRLSLFSFILCPSWVHPPMS